MAEEYLAGIPLAPARKAQASAPINLGTIDPSFEGWYVVIDLDSPVSALEDLLTAGSIDEDLPDEAKAKAGMSALAATRAYLAANLLAWNFSRTLPDGTVEALPQPRDGGVRYLSNSQSRVVSQAIRQAQQPAKNSDAP